MTRNDIVLIIQGNEFKKKQTSKFNYEQLWEILFIKCKTITGTAVEFWPFVMTFLAWEKEYRSVIKVFKPENPSGFHYVFASLIGVRQILLVGISEYLLDPRPRPEGSYKIGCLRPSFRPSFHLSVSFLRIASLVLSGICVKWKFLWFINILQKLHACEKSGSQVIAKNGSRPMRFQYSLIVNISLID